VPVKNLRNPDKQKEKEGAIGENQPGFSVYLRAKEDNGKLKIVLDPFISREEKGKEIKPEEEKKENKPEREKKEKRNEN
jgi:hypothetical protein